MYTGLTPYTRYRTIVMAKSAGSTGPAAETSISTPSEGISVMSYQYTWEHHQLWQGHRKVEANLFCYVLIFLSICCPLLEKRLHIIVLHVIVCLLLAPGAVSYLRAVAVDSTSVRLSWGTPNQPNGLITRYRILVLHHDMLVQDITLRALQQVNTHTHLHRTCAEVCIPCGHLLHFLFSYNCLYVADCGSAGANPSWHLTIGEVHPGQVTDPCQG